MKSLCHPNSQEPWEHPQPQPDSTLPSFLISSHGYFGCANHLQLVLASSSEWSIQLSHSYKMRMPGLAWGQSVASRHSIAHRNQGQGLGVDGKCSMCSQGWRTGIQDKGLLHQNLYSLHSLLCSSPTFLALLSVLLPKLSKWVKVGVESFGMRPFTPFPSVNSRMTTDSVIQNWSRNTVQTSFG